MPRGRRKHPALKILRDEILPSRRSSLRVNLSYVSDLSDSGNESFKSTQPENNSSAGRKGDVTPNRIVSAKIPENSKLSVPSASAMLSAMREQEMALGKSCQVLKEAILNKTREIFDGRAELAVKTATVLKGRRRALKEINEDSKSAGTDRNITSSSVILDPAARNKSTEGSSVDISMRRTKSSSRISKVNESVILGSSDKFHDNTSKSSKTREKLLMVSLTRMADPRLEVSMESNISEIGAPITCSSFIAEHGNFDGPSSRRVENVAIGERVDAEGSTRNAEDTSLTTSEITAVQARPTAPCARNITKSQGRGDAPADRSSDQTVPMELTTVQSYIPLLPSTNSNKTARTLVNANTPASVLSRSPKTPKRARSLNRCKDNSQDDRTAEISLNVNTSLDSEEQKTSEEERIPFSEENDSERSPGARVARKGTIISDSDTESLDSVSLIERLRNISAKKLVHKKKRSCAEEGPSFVEGTPCPPSRSILWRTQIRSETIRIKSNATRLKQHFAQALTNRPSKSSDSDSSAGSAEFTNAPNSTVVPGRSPYRITCNTANPRIIEDSSMEVDSSRLTKPTIPDGNAVTCVRKKKKLLPLRDKFELVSFSPVSAEKTPPKKPTTWMPRRHFRRRKLVRAIAEKRMETLLKENEDEDEPASCSTSGAIGTREEPSRVRKPRKVISKKIVVKKIVTNELEECLGHKNSEQSSVASERSSVNEFLKKKKLSVTGRNSKPQKLFVVATGFSKGDSDLVRSVVKELGGAEINTTVNRRTTHVVSTGVRTINLLRGIIRGCWMVTLEWVLKSLEKGEWLNAEQYEMVHFSKAVQENRRDRQLFGKAYIPELFTTCGPIHIEHGTSPPPEILKELVKTAGGRVAENSREARLSIGPNGLREIWILDSITTGDLQPVDEYHRK